MVTVLATVGTFGSPTGTTGKVKLNRQSTGQTIEVPQANITWSPVAVSFTVPPDLPAGQTQATWEVTVEPGGTPSVCGPYSLSIRAVPALLFAPPLCISERRIDVAALGIGPNAQVRFYDRNGTRIVHNIPPQKRTASGIACQVPTLRELMVSSDFDANQLTMRLFLTVFDPDSNQETPQTAVHSSIAVLPPPEIGPVTATTGANEIVFGDPARPADLGDLLSLEWTGAPERGTVTFHRLDAAFLEQVALLRREIATLIDTSNPDVTPNAALVGRLNALAGQAGGRPASAVPEWTEERIRVVPLAGWNAGAVLVWRDSLPSSALVVPQLPLPDVCQPLALKAALGELVALETPAAPLDPGQTLTARLVPTNVPDAQLSEAARTLKDLLEDGTATLRVGYQVIGNGPFAGAPTSGTPFEGGLGQLPVTLVQGLAVQPAVVAHERDPSPHRSSMTILAEVTVTNMPACPAAIKVTLSSPPIMQLPIRLPTLVAFSDQRRWAGETLICVQPTTSLLAGFADRTNQGAVGAAKAALLAPIDTAIAALSALAGLFPAMLGVSSLADLTNFTNRLRGKATNDLVVTAEGARGRLNYDPAWWDKASSMFMIGVPDGTTTFRLWERDNQSSHLCEFRMPGGWLVASYETLHESAFRSPDRDTFSSPPDVPEPGVLQSGRADSYPFGSFGNMAKSFDWA